jgi:hypothetical protein
VEDTNAKTNEGEMKMSYTELKIETLAKAKTMTRTEVENWINTEDNTTVRLILWNAING